MSACATTVYTTDQADALREFRDFTEAIQAADSHEAKLKLLAEKQLLHPPRRSPERSEKAAIAASSYLEKSVSGDIYTTRNGEDWREILAEKQCQDRIRRRDCVAVADIDVPL